MDKPQKKNPSSERLGHVTSSDAEMDKLTAAIQRAGLAGSAWAFSAPASEAGRTDSSESNMQRLTSAAEKVGLAGTQPNGR